MCIYKHINKIKPGVVIFGWRPLTPGSWCKRKMQICVYKKCQYKLYKLDIWAFFEHRSNLALIVFFFFSSGYILYYESVPSSVLFLFVWTLQRPSSIILLSSMWHLLLILCWCFFTLQRWSQKCISVGLLR